MIRLLLIAAFFSISLPSNVPKTLVLDGENLNRNAQAIAEKSDPSKTKALDELTEKAGKILEAGKLYSVMQKTQVPPSGDKHDYISQGPYWWPDPKKPDGKPYIRKDGQVNPEYYGFTDHNQLGDLIGDTELLALAYYFTGDEKYAQFATRLLQTWFLDKETKMNPHLNYGQGIPGKTEGRGIGIIDTRAMYRLIDAAIILQESKSWTERDHQALKSWFSDYLTWLTESPIGLDEADEHNNHGTYYDVQVIASALFVGRNDLARKQVEVVKSRLASQLEADGSQPHELSRTLSWNYTNMNLLGFVVLARLAEHVNVDLWKYENADGKGIRKAIDWLVPYATDEKAWTHKQIKERDYGTTRDILDQAARKYSGGGYGAVAGKLKSDYLGLLTN